MNNIEERIIQAIKKYDTIIIHRHMRPDPDALGSQLGLKEIIRTNFPEKEVYAVGKTVEDLGYMGKMDEITDEKYHEALVIVTDTANTPRVSDERFALGKMLIKIDHHPNDEPYGDIVYVDTNVSSASELITRLACQMGLALSNEAARLLYGGIVGDTGRFLYPATTAETLKIAAHLRTYDFDASKLNRQLSQMPLNIARLSGYVYQNIEADENGVAKVYLTKEIMEKYKADDAQTAHLVALPGGIDSILTWGIFVEQPNGKFRVRLRSKGPLINEVAKRHDGGGHPLASGANAKDLAECEQIYQELQQAAKEYKNEYEV
ncbi:MAG: bifunctional oligoribonuclease/PAP phosphatase NrnA [Streptococcaceae bacterium]|jgi:phosphoesterase RecJ-like protein|nr:bifunctional oligoribonuclease/PAP phosphatase NrnA [Streptococcaceae bacterium]